MRKQKLSITQVVLFLLALLLAQLSAEAYAGSIISDKYDSYFKDHSIHLPVGTDWRLLKAQCYQESRLNPLAVSPVGAFGLCQFMPATAGDMKSRYGELKEGDFWLPEVSVLAAALYMNQLNNFWSSPRPQMDRYMLALASYNAGAGHLVKAQKLSGGMNQYSDIIFHLHKVTGHHSKETTEYVNNIVGKWYVILLFN